MNVNSFSLERGKNKFNFVRYTLNLLYSFKRYTFFYKEQVYKEPEAENGLKNKELLRNLAG